MKSKLIYFISIIGLVLLLAACGNNGLKEGTYKFAQSSGIDYLNVDMVMEVPKDNADKVKLKYEGETINGTVKDGKMIFFDGDDKESLHYKVEENGETIKLDGGEGHNAIFRKQ